MMTPKTMIAAAKPAHQRRRRAAGEPLPRVELELCPLW